MIEAAVLDAITDIAKDRYPHEAVFAVWPNQHWEELKNISPYPKLAWELSGQDIVRLITKPPLVLIHSHPGGNAFPSDEDSRQQIEWKWPWGIIALHGNGVTCDSASPPVYWGDKVPKKPLLGREYIWGIQDCFAVCRDFYTLNGKRVPDVPRLFDPMIYTAEQCPWASDVMGHWFPKLGLKEIKLHQLEAGDAVSIKWRQSQHDHAMIYLGDNKYLEHHRGRLSEIRHRTVAYLIDRDARFYRWKASNAKDRASWQIEGPLSQGL